MKSAFAVGLILLYNVVNGAVTSTKYTNITTSYSDISGPSLAAYSYTWSKYVTATTVGTVEVVINTDTNRTYTTTKTNTEFSTNGTLSILTRTDTNAAGTVTAVQEDLFGTNITVAYPTHVLALATDFMWEAILPTAINQTSCCWPSYTYSDTPTHTPFAEPTGQIDSADPSGWLYTLVGFQAGDPDYELGPTEVSSLWTGETIAISYSGCGYTLCSTYITTAAGASVVYTTAFLFATSTITTSGLEPTATSRSSSISDTKMTGVEVDPITASVVSTSQTASAASTTSVPVKTSVATSVHTSASIPESTTHTSDLQAPSASSSVSDVSKPTSTAVKTPLTQTTSDVSSPTYTFESASETSDVDSLSAILATTAKVEGSTATQSYTSTVENHSTASPSENPESTQQARSSTLAPSIASSQPSGSDTNTVALSKQSSAAALSHGSSVLNAPTVSSITTSSNLVPIIIGSSTVTPDASSRYVVSGQTLEPGSKITVGSGLSTAVLGLATSGSQTFLVVGSSTSEFSQQAVTTAPVSKDLLPVLTVGSSVVSANSASEYIVGSQTLALGSTITVSSDSHTTLIALPTSGSETLLVVDSSTAQLVQAQTSTDLLPVLTLGDYTINPDSASGYVIGSQTLAPGSTITAGSGSSTAVVALETSDFRTYIVIDSSTSALAQIPTSVALAATLTLGPSVITLDSASKYVIGTQTLLPGTTLTVDYGSTTAIVALETSNSQTLLVIDSSTSILEQPPASTVLVPAFTLGTSIVTPNPASEYVVGTQTLQPGGSAISVSGTVISLASGATELIVGGSTEALEIASAASSSTNLPVFTLGSSTITPDSASAYLIGSQTLKPGAPAITVSGTVISLASDATKLFVGSSVEVGTSVAGLGGYIWSGIAGTSATSTEASGAPSSSSGGSSTSGRKTASGSSSSQATSLSGSSVRTSAEGSAAQTTSASDASFSKQGGWFATIVLAIISALLL